MNRRTTAPRGHVDYDLEVQISPYRVFRRLADGEDLLLVDLGTPEGARPAMLERALDRPPADWAPPRGRDVVLFDQDGGEALEAARAWRSAGYERVWALFGGLDLWDLALGGHASLG